MCFDGRKPEAESLMRAVGAAKDRAEGRGVIPATCPACSSRDIQTDASVPDWWYCRNCELEWDGPEAGPGPVPVAVEDRGTPLWIWRDAAGWLSFVRTPDAVERCEISVPIGRRLRPDRELGVVLADTFGETLSAWAAWDRAGRGVGGFRLRAREAIG